MPSNSDTTQAQPAPQARDAGSEKTEGAKRTQLGRGLAALFGEEGADYGSADKLRATKTIPVEQLHPNPLQPRRAFDEEGLESLAASIRAQGVLQPLVVRQHPEHADQFQIVAGERRWRAAQRAQVHELPVVIRQLSDDETLEIALVENVQREDLSPLEEARGYLRLAEDFGHTQAKVAELVGKSRSHVANSVRLLTLPEAVQKMIESGQLSAGHARALIGHDSAESLAKRIVDEDLSVREAERLVQQSKRDAGDAAKTPTSLAPQTGAKPAKPAKDADTLALERDLAALLGLKVTIGFEGEGGVISIHYKTLEQLDDVLRRLNQPLPEGTE